MKPEHWQQLNELFHAAVQRKSEARALFLDEACAGDDALPKQTEALLAAHERGGKLCRKSCSINLER
jgi:hypothetical protein